MPVSRPDPCRWMGLQPSSVPRRRRDQTCGRPAHPSPRGRGLAAAREGHTGAMQRRRGELWLEAAAGLQTDLDAEVRADAYEVFLAEAARDASAGPARPGAAGAALRPDLSWATSWRPVEVGGGADCIALRQAGGRACWCPRSRRSLTMTGGRPALQARSRPASRPIAVVAAARGVAARRRRCGVLLRDGRWITGPIAHVGADHVELGDVARADHRAVRVGGRLAAGLTHLAGRGSRVSRSRARRRRRTDGSARTVRVWSYIRAMYSSSAVDSTRHWPRPPILIAGRSPLRTRA